MCLLLLWCTQTYHRWVERVAWEVIMLENQKQNSGYWDEMNAQVFIGSTQKMWHTAKIVSSLKLVVHETSKNIISLWISSHSKRGFILGKTELFWFHSHRWLFCINWKKQLLVFFDMFNQISTLEKGSSLKEWLVPGTGCPGVWSQHQACQN